MGTAGDSSILHLFHFKKVVGKCDLFWLERKRRWLCRKKGLMKASARWKEVTALFLYSASWRCLAEWYIKDVQDFSGWAMLPRYTGPHNWVLCSLIFLYLLYVHRCVKKMDLGMHRVGYHNCDGDAGCQGDDGELAVMALVVMQHLWWHLSLHLPFPEKAEHEKTVVGYSPANLCLPAWDQSVGTDMHFLLRVWEWH